MFVWIVCRGHVHYWFVVSRNNLYQYTNIIICTFSCDLPIRWTESVIYFFNLTTFIDIIIVFYMFYCKTKFNIKCRCCTFWCITVCIFWTRWSGRGCVGRTGRWGEWCICTWFRQRWISFVWYGRGNLRLNFLATFRCQIVF